MTAEQLIEKLNNLYGLNQWPLKMELDAETYGYVCEYIINQNIKNINLFFEWENMEPRVSIALGPTKGIMFKNVEMILWKG